MKIERRCRNHTSNGGMVTQQASTKRAPLMHGYDSDGAQVLEPFYNRRNEQGLKRNVELTKLLPLATQADASGGIR